MSGQILSKQTQRFTTPIGVLWVLLSLYWSFAASGPAIWLIELQATYIFNDRYSGKLTFIALVLVGIVPLILIGLIIDRIFSRGVFGTEQG